MLRKKVLSKFVDALPIPTILKPVQKDAGNTYYEVNMTEFKQKLHSEMPETTVWGYENSYPGPTIEVEAGEKVFIKWQNSLPTMHLLPIDHTVHGAHHDVPDVRTVVHVHGASVEAESDGYPEAWFTNGFKEVGPYFIKKIYRYDNDMRACMLWYHDHALGITRLNVYAGLAGVYIIRSSHERSLNLPSGRFEIPLIIQDKSFRENGSLYYPSQPDQPIEGLDVSIVAEFFGETNLVNGKVWPYLDVEPRKYRFRILNAANSRFYRIQLDSEQLFYQIGTEGGFMEHPIGVTEIMIAPAERVDVIIDFTNMNGKKIKMINDAPAPFPSGDKPNREAVGEVMEFRVSLSLSSIDTSVIPAYIGTLPQLPENMVQQKRYLTLDSKRDRYGRELMIQDDKKWDEPISEIMQVGTVELWYFINLTGDTHPMHIHLNDFQIIDRRPFDVDVFKKKKVIRYTGPAIPPEPQERGWKDTVRANPNEVTRVIKKFGPYTGLYVWHCHMLEHEDYEMMRPFFIINS
ncbi:multicopper oxidase family protein [Bacillus massiliigorillae]|uniref:multicopper oxidase family protein n=1 Tax=Bacillus massiliigorillae TaxID=1243664 RepID=UPI0005A95DA6|nr:multicopper oxidase [Bacillus massiliigorillae]